MSRTAALLACAILAGCGATSGIGEAPEFTPPVMSQEHTAMMTPGLPAELPPIPTAAFAASAPASLWTGDRGSLLGDRRAMERGDIMTVVISIDDSAQINNSSDRSRSADQEMGIPSLFGIPERIEERMPTGSSLDPAVGVTSSSNFSGDGSVSRAEQLELRIAATIVDVLPNGVLEIAGTQEVRVNFELRELTVTGFVRTADITRQNEVTYDKIAQARISYGGRGQISDMQQPRYGQQALEYALPF